MKYEMTIDKYVEMMKVEHSLSNGSEEELRRLLERGRQEDEGVEITEEEIDKEFSEERHVLFKHGILKIGNKREL